ncbi:unnamed protein product [Enterobius vermicularis]|uniref:Activin_recp domain-containing protein n=1 Tax=Enterobius vermicularis TaxID=51028 RepID=A0A0N4V978_ENTVE|nr:unnamed protein product [Enterobius vermicularis]
MHIFCKCDGSINEKCDSSTSGTCSGYYCTKTVSVFNGKEIDRGCAPLNIAAGENCYTINATRDVVKPLNAMERSRRSVKKVTGTITYCYCSSGDYCNGAISAAQSLLLLLVGIVFALF